MFSRQRFVVAGVLGLALVLGFTLDHLLEWAWVWAGWDDPFLFGVRQLRLSSMLALVVAVSACVFVLKFPTTYNLANEIVDELAKVNWPTREETGHATVVVIISVVICSTYLGAFDGLWLALTNWILDIRPLKEG